MLIYIYPIFLGLSFHLTHSILGMMCSWVFLLGWCLAYQNKQLSYMRSLISGVLFCFVACSWLPIVIQGYFDVSYILALCMSFLVALLIGYQWVFTHWLFMTFHYSWLERYALRLPVAWSVAEILCVKVFPWSIANTQMSWPPILQIADIGGAPFVTFCLLWIASFFMQGIVEFGHKSGVRSQASKIFVALILLSTVLGYGYIRMSMIDDATENAETIMVGVVQPEFDPRTHFKKEYVSEDMKEMRTLSRSYLSSSEVDLLIWPESSVVYNYWSNERRIKKGSFRDPLPNAGAPLLFGGQVKIKQDILYEESEKKDTYYNAALLLDERGEFVGRYYKQVLFPYAEEVPLSEFFPVLSQLSQAPLQLVPAKEQGPIPLTLRSYEKKKQYSLGTVICYEDMMPWPLLQVTKNAERAPDVLIALSNDSWFFHTIAPQQHHVIASLRAIEYRKYFVRVSVDGLTGLINPNGQTIELLKPFVSGSQELKVPLLEESTIFVRGGAKFSYYLAILVLTWSLWIYLSEVFAMLFRKA